MEATNTTGKSHRVQTVIPGETYRRLTLLREKEDRTESKMAAILIDEALQARAANSRTQRRLLQNCQL